MEKKKRKIDDRQKRINDQVKGLIEIRDKNGNIEYSNYKPTRKKVNGK